MKRQLKYRIVDETRSTILAIRLSPVERRIVEQIAAKHEMTASAWVRRTIIWELERDIKGEGVKKPGRASSGKSEVMSDYEKADKFDQQRTSE